MCAAFNDILLKFEIRNAVNEQAADAIVAIINRHLVSALTHALCSSEAGGTGANNADCLAALSARANGIDPALFPRRLSQILFDSADGNAAMAALLDHARAFAEAILRADAAADFGHRIGRSGKPVSVFEPAFGGELQPVGDVVLERAVRLAERHTALRATRGLIGGFLGNELAVDLKEIRRPLLGRALIGPFLPERHEFLHAFGHRTPS